MVSSEPYLCLSPRISSNHLKLSQILRGSVSVQSARKSLASELQRRGTDPSQAGLGLVLINDLQSMAREEGEGMETTETETPSPSVQSLPSLEHLLTSPDPKQGQLE